MSWSVLGSDNDLKLEAVIVFVVLLILVELLTITAKKSLKIPKG